MKRTLVTLFVLALLVGSAEADLVRHWDFDGNFTDNVVNETGVGRNGAGFGEDRFGGASGALSIAMSQYVEFANGSAMNNLQTGSIALWVAWSGLQDIGFAAAYGAVTGRQWNGRASNQIISLNNTNPAVAAITWRPYAAGGAALTSTTIAGDGEWHHIAITYTSGQHKLYIDGSLEDTSTAAGSVVDASSGVMPFTVGAWIGDGNSYSTSRIDDLRIYDHVLSQGEVTALIPEPTSIVLLGVCSTGLLLRRRR